MTTEDVCPTCRTYLYTRRLHKCPPRWLVFIGEDACPNWGEPDNNTPSTDESDWTDVYAIDDAEAAETVVTAHNETNEYYMMNQTYPVWVRPFPYNSEDIPKRFNVSAEPSVHYNVSEA